MVVPSLPPSSASPGAEPAIPRSEKDALRLAAMQARKAFVRTLSDGDRALLERRLAERLTALCAGASVVAGYAALGSEISPLRAIEEARSVGAIVAFPAFADPGKPFRFLAGDPVESGPFGILQPKLGAPKVDPDLVLVPLVAIDNWGARLGRGKGHYDRALGPLRKAGARLIGVGWSMQLLPERIPADDWDVPLHAFASPDGVRFFETG